MVALQRRGVIFMTVLLRNTLTYLVGLRPANLTFTLYTISAGTFMNSREEWIDENAHPV